MSGSYLSVACSVCNEPFRNRQSLHRHQKRSGCKGSYRLAEITNLVQYPLSSVSPVEVAIKTEVAVKSEVLLSLEDVFDQLYSKLPDAMSGRYTNDICDLDGLVYWSNKNCVDFIMDLTESPIPMQIITGARVGTMATYLKL
jgi:hypothetical protein